MPLPFIKPVVLKALLDEYQKFRKEELNTFTGMVGNAYSYMTGGLTTGKIDACCKDFNNDFANAKTATEWVTIILKLGKIAHEAQQKSSNPSDLCETLHAIRSFILTRANEAKEYKDAEEKQFKTELKRECQTKAAQLRNDYLNKIDELEKAMKGEEVKKGEKKTKVDIQTIRHERDIILRNLAYLNETKEILVTDSLERLFPKVQYPPEKTDESFYPIESPNKYSDHIPWILQPNFIFKYLEKHMTGLLGAQITLDHFEEEIVNSFKRQNQLNEKDAKPKETPPPLPIASPVLPTPLNVNEAKSDAAELSPKPEAAAKASTAQIMAQTGAAQDSEAEIVVEPEAPPHQDAHPSTPIAGLGLLKPNRRGRRAPAAAATAAGAAPRPS